MFINFYSLDKETSGRAFKGTVSNPETLLMIEGCTKQEIYDFEGTSLRVRTRVFLPSEAFSNRLLFEKLIN